MMDVDRQVPKRRLPPTVFLSYPHTIYGWVQEHIYEPLAARWGDEIWMDRHAGGGGRLLIERLTRPVVDCRVFLPVLCPAYFASRWCRWELALRLSLDPLCEEKRMLAVVREPVALPEYLCLFSTLDGQQADVTDQILAAVSTILSGSEEEPPQTALTRTAACSGTAADHRLR